MSMDELLALPVSVSLLTAARALGITANQAYALVGKVTSSFPWRCRRAS